MRRSDCCFGGRTTYKRCLIFTSLFENRLRRSRVLFLASTDFKVLLGNQEAVRNYFHD
jgi:hypothetical protein